MKFLHKTFEAKRKQIIEVDIDVATKVKFMTAKDMKMYKMGKTHTFVGGLYEESPVRFVVPFDSVWNVVVEKGTHHAPIEVHASCKLLIPNSTVRTSIAADAPASHKELAFSDPEAESLANEINLAGRSEG
jgi:hypothetical protein